jgi:methionyl-tRNA synthetase
MGNLSMPSASRKMLTTCALPYANGPLHLGHMVEAIQTDIWVRFQRLRGHTCYFICGNDAHGTAIMLSAQREKLSPDQFIAKINTLHQQDYMGFAISFDWFSTTHSAENQRFVEMIYRRLRDGNAIFKQEIEQFFDTQVNLFLPDRFIKGTCPKCQSKDQYGDNCEVCGSTYRPTDLKDPVSALSGSTPVIRNTEHYFFDLPLFTKQLKNWVQTETLQDEIINKLQEWFAQGLQPWDITRDKPYFGFPIPDAPDKYFYVWLDAPIGYISIFKQFCDQKQVDFTEFWQPKSSTELYHFIGKDVMYFHTLFWPAMLMGADLRLPTAIFTHGFLTIDGQKMSKSRGTFIKAKTYLDHLDSEFIRYYFAAKLTDRVEDIDLNWNDFVNRVNADLVGKVINIASRCAKFINEHFNDLLANECIDLEMFDDFVAAGDGIALCYENREFSRAIREIMQLADRANRYIDEQKPWALLKEPGNEDFVQEICSMGLNLFLIIMTYLKPILPNTTEAVEKFLRIPPITWRERDKPLIKHPIAKFAPLLQRITQEQIDALKEASQMQDSESPAISDNIEAIFPEINYDDFAKIDLRIARIDNAEHVEGAEKLLKLTLNIGNENRQVFAGIKSAYQPEQLIGKYTVMVANLAPRKMRFGISEGMVLAAGPGGKELWILEPHSGAQPGMRVK